MYRVCHIGEVGAHDATRAMKGVPFTMRKVIFLLGVAVGYVLGTKAGRERYEQIVKYSRQAANHPAVQNAKQQATTKATDLGKTAAAKAPEMARNAVPKVVSAAKTAKQTASDRLPFTGKNSSEEPFDDVTVDPSVPYQADGTSATTFNGARAD